MKQRLFLSSIKHKKMTISKHFLLLFCISFTIRALVFQFFIKPHEYYKQPDSVDYHYSALSLTAGVGMYRLDNQEPIFWRTPGYPWYLSYFYSGFGIRGFNFEQNSAAQQAAIWGQIFISSCLPLIIFFLALLLTSIINIAWISAWIFALHPGFVLASTYLLTEGLALIFFYLFLLFLYQNIVIVQRRWFLYIFLAAVMLGIFTWIRPMGECISIVAAFILLIFAHPTKRGKPERVLKAFLFILIFFGSLFPWYLRNHQLTGEWFFCPTIGTYFNCFCVPKILRRTLHRPIEECHKMAQHAAALSSYRKKIELQGTGKYVCPSVCKKVAFPIILQYPGYFLYDGILEILKTTFDLHTYQLVTMLQGTYWYDPIEEFLPDKIAACLYKQPMPLLMRILCWLELIFSFFIWLGIFCGLFYFVLRPITQRKKLTTKSTHILIIWVSCALLAISVIVPSGGFGYARLRLPAEPLIIIMSLLFWYEIYNLLHSRTKRP